MSNLIEMDRVRVIDIGGSLYALIPKFLRRNDGVSSGDEAIYFHEIESGEIVLRIGKPPDENGNPRESARKIHGNRPESIIQPGAARD